MFLPCHAWLVVVAAGWPTIGMEDEPEIAVCASLTGPDRTHPINTGHHEQKDLFIRSLSFTNCNGRILPPLLPSENGPNLRFKV